MLSTLRKMPLAIAVSSIIANQGAVAQSQEEPQSGIETIIVTSQKRAENLQEIPIPISAFSADDLERRQVVSTRDLVGSVASLNGMETAPTRGNFSVTLRGVSGGSPNSLSTDPVVAIYTDGIFQGKQIASTMDVADIERVEVLRGPQGTLYGRNATAGAINFITRKPSGDFRFKGTASVGSDNLRGIKLNADLPAIGYASEGLGSLSTSIGVTKRVRDEFYGNTNPNLDGFEDLDRQAIRFAARWELGDDFIADYVYSKGELDELGPLSKPIYLNAQSASGSTYIDTLKGIRDNGLLAGRSQRLQGSFDATITELERIQAEGEGRPRNGSSDSVSTSKSESQAHSLSLSWEAEDLGRLGDVTFTSITGYSDVENRNIGDIDGIDSSVDANGIGAVNPITLLQTFNLGAGTEAFLINPLIDQFGAGHYGLDMTMNYESFSQELQMVGSTDKLDYVVGLYYYEDEGQNRNTQFAVQPIGGVNKVNYDNATAAEAFFTQFTYRPTDPLAITVGARYSKENKEITYLYEDASAFTPGYDGITTTPKIVDGVSQFNQKADKNYYNSSGTVNVAYDVKDDLMVYGTIATGFHSGYFVGDTFSIDKPLKEEIITNYELGIKSSWLDNRLRVNASAYHYEFKDIQVSQTAIVDGILSSFFVNAGSAKREGFELDVTALPTDELRLTLSYAFINGDFNEYPPHCASSNAQPPVVSCIPLVNDAKRARTPDHAVRFFANYVFARTDFAEYTGLLGIDWQGKAAASAVWTGAINGVPVVNPQIYNNERTLVSLRLAAENIEVGDAVVTIALSGQNLFDEDYSTMGINFGQAIGHATQNYGSPRTWILDLSYKY